MTCCRSRRSTTQRTDRHTDQLPARPTVTAAAVDGTTVRLRFLGREAIRVRGTASGQLYRVTPADPVLAVDPRDVRVLVRSGLFRH